jgi:solute carrier family 25 protein 39/40
LRKYFKEDWIYSPLVAGTSARLLAATITSPLEYVRTVVQAGTNLNQIKWKNMWTGLGATILRDTPFSAIYWMSFETIKKRLRQSNDTPMSTFTVAFISGATSGALAAMITTPIDVIKTRIQAAPSDQKYTMSQTAKLMYQQDGIRAFFIGFVPRLARVAPACAIMISSYELLKRFL